MVTGAGTDQDADHEAGGAAGGAQHERGQRGQRHLQPVRQAVRGRYYTAAAC